MIPNRRRFLKKSAAGLAGIGAGCVAKSVSGYSIDPSSESDTIPVPNRVAVEEPEAGEDLIQYVHRQRGGWDESLFKQLLGAANEFKEGDAAIGVAAVDDQARQRARLLLGRTPIARLDAHRAHRDTLANFIDTYWKPDRLAAARLVTMDDLAKFLLKSSEDDIHRIKAGLSSDVIACVVRLFTNEQLIAVSSKIFNPLPGSQIGARGFLGARIQPNSPTDNVDDIRWQVFDAFAYGVGDVLLGTNPVSSNPESVLAVELALQDILKTFGLTDAMPHCVLTHIDIQAEVERNHPGSTALWFQSIAGNDKANATFDLTVEKMAQYARSRRGAYGLYFETGQGADFTNGHADGCDMVLLESRKYGFARALATLVAEAGGLLPEESVWVHVNDVAGFIGPEVFRTREQLVRCCLEDLVMGKLHGLTIGLDVCSTLHMEVTLADLDWCLHAIAPAQPAYLMALPTKIDPMLGYMTTAYQDHVRLREQFGFRVNDRCWSFFKEIGVIDAVGGPTEHFGDPVWVYQQYRKRKGDLREPAAIAAEANAQLAAIRDRGVFMARGYGSRPSELEPGLARQIEHIYRDSKDCIWRKWEESFVARIPSAISITTRSIDRNDYILHPESGERLSADSLNTLLSIKAKNAARYDLQFVISEGLNALALMDEGNLLPLLGLMRLEAESLGYRIAPENLIVHNGRVRAGYRIGETLFQDLDGIRTMLHVIGERPGSGHHTMSVYITKADVSLWKQPDKVDHNITRVVSGIATSALKPEQAAKEVRRILAGR